MMTAIKGHRKEGSWRRGGFFNLFLGKGGVIKIILHAIFPSQFSEEKKGLFKIKFKNI